MSSPRELGQLRNELSWTTHDGLLRRSLRDELIASGRAQVHRWRPDSGWVTIPLAGQHAAADVIEALRGAYE